MKTAPPPPGTVRNVLYPSVSAAKSSAGLDVFCLTRDHLPRATVLIGFPFGKAHDPRDVVGLGQATCEMLKEGTPTRSSRQIAETLDRMAMVFSAEVTLEQTILSLSLLDRYLEEGLELLADLVLYPEFPDEELEKLRVRWRSVLVAQRADSGFLGLERLFLRLFDNHPYSQIGLVEEHLDKLDRPALALHCRRLLNRDAATVLFAGPVSETIATGLTDRYLRNWTSNYSKLPDLALLPPLSPNPKVAIVDRPDSAQAKVLVGFRGLERKHPDFLRLRVANQILGGGASSRLFLRLREELGITYGIYSSLHAFGGGGTLVASCSTHNEKAEVVVREVLAAVKLLRNETPTADELERSQSELIGDFIRRLETSSSVGLLEMNRRLAGLPENYYHNLIPEIAGIRTQDVPAVLQAHVDPGSAVVVAVGNAAQLARQLDWLGETAVYETSGRRRP